MESTHERSVHTVRNTEDVDQLKSLYPMVNEEETPLPRQWDISRRHLIIRLVREHADDNQIYYESHNERYKNEAFSIRTTDPIPSSCGLYYFEIKVLKATDSKSNVAIGLSSKDARISKCLPGCRKISFGYHGKDGYKYCCTEGSDSLYKAHYGPTFSTGDVVGCGINLVDNTLFFTLNGINLGPAFSDIPLDLYPTVGLKTPNDIVNANFGKSPFRFDIMGMINEMRQNTNSNITSYPNVVMPNDLQRMVVKYLLRHGYCDTAEALIKASCDQYEEIDFNRLKSKKKILMLLSAGRIKEAVELSNKLYPNLLKNNENLMFALRCREFIEMIDRHCPDLHTGTDNQTSVIKFNKLSIESNANEDSNNHVAKRRKISENDDDSYSVQDSYRTSSQNNSFKVNIDQQLVDFVKELYAQCLVLEEKYGKDKYNEKMLQDACSLLSYANPKNSPISWMLDPIEREPLIHRMNTAMTCIDNNNSMPEHSALDVALSFAKYLIERMSKKDLSECGFATLDNIIPPIVSLSLDE